jgi:Ser/Thr protein kinase RdoA (MazF antagonist)
VRGSFSARHARAFGELAGRFHSLSAAFQPPAGFARQTLDADSLSGEATGFPRELIRSRLDAASLAVIDRAVEAVRRTWETVDERALAHGDLHLANTLWVRSEPHLIDFDDMGWAPLAYDLAVARLECLERAEGEALWRELLSGYASVRPLPPGAETRIDEFVTARRVFVVMWLTGNRDHPAFSRVGDYVAGELAALSA